MTGHRLDDAGALVEAVSPAAHAGWSYDGHWGWHNNADVVIATLTIQARKGHEYLITGVVSGYGILSNLAHQRGYYVTVEGKEEWKAVMGLVRSPISGNILANHPIPIIATHMASADGEMKVVLSLRRDPAEQEWELAPGIHNLHVMDLSSWNAS